MSSEVPSSPRNLPLVKLGLAVVVLAAVAVLLLRGVDLVALKNQFIGLIRDAGPVVFFVAMALLPAVGLPMLAFTITAGEAFAPRMTMAGVVAVSLAVVALNLALCYWVVRYLLRPLLLFCLIFRDFRLKLRRARPITSLSRAAKDSPPHQGLGPPRPASCPGKDARDANCQGG